MPNRQPSRPRAALRWVPLAATALLVVASCSLLAGCSGGDKNAAFQTTTAGFLRAALHDAPTAADDDSDAEHRLAAARARFYQQRAYAPAWIERKQATAAAEELVATLEEAGELGLDPATYRADELRAELDAWGERPPRGRRSAPAASTAEATSDESSGPAAADDAGGPDTERARRGAALDAELTAAYLTIASHLGLGRVRPADAGIAWHTTPRELDLTATLQQALDGKGVRESLRTLEPPHAGYRQLADLHQTYRKLAAAGGWQPIPDGPALAAGDRGPRVAALRRRLEATGDLAGTGVATPDDLASDAATGERPAAAEAVYDAEVAAAVDRFQRRYGLEPDGKAGDHVLAELNVPVAERLRQIEANLERWRWLPAELGSRYIMVNVPRYELAIVEDGKVVDTMRVVVGEDYNATPVFSDEMSYVVLNPTWNLPSSIARSEILPKLANDPGYLESHDMQLVRGWSDDAEVLDPWAAPPEVVAGAGQDSSEVRLRQVAGPSNPLGRIKFMFPNQYNIYLHDTNARQLFSRTDRNLSHGCIRVEHPIQLASYVLGKSASEIESQIAGGETKSLSLPQKIPVHIFYWTAFVDEKGGVNFRDDLYGVDERVLAALDHTAPTVPALTIPTEPMSAPAEGEGKTPAEGALQPAGDDAAPASRDQPEA